MEWIDVCANWKPSKEGSLPYSLTLVSARHVWQSLRIYSLCKRSARCINVIRSGLGCKCLSPGILFHLLGICLPNSYSNSVVIYLIHVAKVIVLHCTLADSISRPSPSMNQKYICDTSLNSYLTCHYIMWQKNTVHLNVVPKEHENNMLVICKLLASQPERE